MQGLGYQEARQQRISEGYTASNMEAKGNEEFLLYFGRVHVDDFETGITARGLLKVGRGKFKTALMRGRNQPGVDFRIYAEIIVSTNKETHEIEEMAHKVLADKHVPGSQGQKELFNVADNEIVDTVYSIAEVAVDNFNLNIQAINFYLDGTKTSAADEDIPKNQFPDLFVQENSAPNLFE